MVLFSEKRNMPLDFPFAREMLRGPAIRTVAAHQQVRRPAFERLRQDPNAIERALYRPEVGEANQQLLATPRIELRPLFLVVRVIQLAVHEILDDTNLV